MNMCIFSQQAVKLLGRIFYKYLSREPQRSIIGDKHVTEDERKQIY